MKRLMLSRSLNFTLIILLLLSGVLVMPQRSVKAAPSAPVNGDFEQGGLVGWSEFSANGRAVVWNAAAFGYSPVIPHSGSWLAYLGDFDNETAYITQSVTIAPNTHMSFWYWTNSEDICGFDFGYITINSLIIQSLNLCSGTNTGGWVQNSLDLSAYNGQTVNLEFRIATDESLISGWVIDDVIFYETFTDVSIANPFSPYIEAFYGAGITVGCNQSPLMYCPDNPVTRGEMAVFIERALGNFAPAPSPTGMFTDLPYPGLETFTPFIEEYYNDGITVGCNQSPLRYCPQNYVTRGEMAVFIERAIGNFSPSPSPTGMFTDIPYPGLETFTPFIEEFYNDGITTGCSQSPLMYCPQNFVTRGEMAVFMVRAFGIPLP